MTLRRVFFFRLDLKFACESIWFIRGLNIKFIACLEAIRQWILLQVASTFKILE